jgi:lysyl-tRNA synthetase, class II
MNRGKEIQKSLTQIKIERKKKAGILLEKGHSLYPSVSFRDHTLSSLRENFLVYKEEEKSVCIAGRVRAVRGHGSVFFVDISDGTGHFQIVIKKDSLSEDDFSLFRDTVERGDFIECKGSVFETQKGEASLLLFSWRMLAKALSPLPTEHFGIKDEEMRYRKRYIDILLNEEVKNRIIRRNAFWKSIRSFLFERDFIEVETPVFETTPGGADAEPFSTHHNALDMDVYLRISAGELWQKRLMVAGIPKTFEIGRVFRNEGMSFEHAQEYTQLEFYEAFSDIEKGKKMIRELYCFIASSVYKKTVFTQKEHTFDLEGEWEEYHFSEILLEKYGIDPRFCSEKEAIETLLKSGIAYKKEKNINKARAVDLLWKEVRKSISGPAFLIGIPVYLEPLAKKNEKDPLVVDRFQVLLAGSELGKGFSELNDSEDQKERFLEQQMLRDKGDREAQFADMDFVEALSYGMPPTFGFGVSERLFSFFEGVSIREAQVFPLLKRKNEDEKEGQEKV